MGVKTGFSTYWFAKKFPKAQIIAIEPDLSNFKILTLNTRKFSNIKLIRSAIWKDNSYLKVKDIGKGHWGLIVEEVPSETTGCIKSITIDDIVKMSEYNTIDILKLDVEGAEKEIFSSNNIDWLNKVNVIIIELHETMKKGCNQAFFSAISKHNFIQYYNCENLILIRKNLFKKQ